MFPIPFNFPFRKKDGSLTTIGNEISEGGGGYTLPTASAETKGGVKIGSGLTMTGEVLSNSNPTPYSLPTASAETLGGVKVGSGLSIEDGVLSATGGGGGGLSYIDYEIPSRSYSPGFNQATVPYSGTTEGLQGKDIISVVARRSTNMYYEASLGNVNPSDTATGFSVVVYNTTSEARSAALPVRIYYM